MIKILDIELPYTKEEIVITLIADSNKLINNLCSVYRQLHASKSSSDSKMIFEEVLFQLLKVAPKYFTINIGTLGNCRLATIGVLKEGIVFHYFYLWYNSSDTRKLLFNFLEENLLDYNQ